MNKTIKSLALGLVIGGVASATYAQGVINFFTFNSTTTKGQVFLPSSTSPIGTQYYGQLFYSDVSATAPQSPLSPVEAFNSSGVINLGNITDPVDDAGNFIWYSLVVWSASGGNTAAAALGANYPSGAVVPAPALTAYGDSSTVRVTLGGIDAENDPPFNVPQANGFNNLTLTATTVPEPSTIVLGGLGVAALLAFRRRK
jgi:hypothetical protein